MISRLATARPSILRAELLRWKGAPPQLLVLLVAGYALVLTALFTLSGMPHTWPAMLGWDNVWAVTVGPLYGVVLGTAVTAMDRRHRAGGTLWRPVPAAPARLARVAVLVGHVLVANVLALVVPLLGCRLGGFAGAAPWSTIAQLVAVCTAAQGALAVLAVVLARAFSPVVALVAGSAFALSALAGGAEGDRWWGWPASWLVRGTIPLTGTHLNGVALAADDPLWRVSPWLPAVLCVGLTALLASVEPQPVRDLLARRAARRVRVSSASAPAATRERGAASTAHTSHSRRRPSAARALLTVVARTAVPWIPVVVLGLGLVFIRWRPARDVAVLEAAVLVPISASVMPIVLWSVLAPGWRSLATRPTRVDGPARLALGACVAWSSLLVALVMAALVTRGTQPLIALRVWACCTVATLFVSSTVAWLAARFGPAVAGGVSVFGIIIGALVGGTALLPVLWPLAPWAWGALAAPLPITLAALAALATAPLTTRLAGRAGIRAAGAE